MYRFRVIGHGTIYPLRISIDNHNISVVASDGYDVTPVPCESFIINPGERFDFVVKADQLVGNYWVRALSMEVRKVWVITLFRKIFCNFELFSQKAIQKEKCYITHSREILSREIPFVSHKLSKNIIIFAFENYVNFWTLRILRESVIDWKIPFA